MKTSKQLLLATVFSILLFGCKPSNESVTDVYVSNVNEAKLGNLIKDSNNHVYRKVSDQIKDIANGVDQNERWQRIDQEDTNRWYYPTLSSYKNTNSPPVFNSSSR